MSDLEAADTIDKLVVALEQIIEFRAARTYSGAIVDFGEQYPDVRIAMEALSRMRKEYG